MMIALGRWLLRRALPSDARDAVVRDLDEEYATHIVQSRGRLASIGWYYRQVAGSLVPALIMRRRRRRGSALIERAVWWDGVVQDVRFALRIAGHEKSFATAVILTFALGIGATTAIFSVVDRVLIRQLPYEDPSRLVRVWSANPRGIPRNSVSPPDFFDLRDQATQVAELAAFAPGDAFAMSTGGEPARVIGAPATANLANLLGLQPLWGRWIGQDDTRGNGANVVVLGEDLWRERFGADPQVIGRPIAIDGVVRTVIGIMPRRFEFPTRDEQLWIPIPDDWRAQPRSAHFLGVVARLRPGIASEAARRTLGAIARRLEGAYPGTNRGWGITVDSLRSSIVGDVETPLLVLLAAVGCVLLIAAANVASLLLARGLARSRDMALRAALGARPGRILRAQLIESVLLAMAGACGGLALAAWALEIFRSIGGSQVPMLEHATLDGRVLIVSFAVSLLAGVVAAALPAWRASRVDGADLLRAGFPVIPATTGTRRAIVCAQIAAATVLVVAGVLLLRSLHRLTSVDTGFQSGRTLLADVSLPAVRYSRDARVAFFSRALERIRSLPGVEAAGAGGPLPLSGQEGLLRFGFLVEGRPVIADQPDRAYLRWATAGYFTAMGIPVRAGRVFRDSDTHTTVPVAVIDEVLARRYFSGDNPIGRRVRTTTERTWREVIGIVGAVHQMALDRDAEPHMYVPQAQMPSPALTLVTRSSVNARTVATGVRDAIRFVDREQPVSNVRTLEDLVAGSVASRRFSTLLLSSFAAIAMLLTAVGVYGVVSQAVAQATREIGVRIALGASGGEVLSLVLARSMRLALVGVTVGAIAARIIGRPLAGLLYGVQPGDPVALMGACVLVSASAALAAYLPARRILRIDVVNALRVE
jgi:putative ABC transport system permease protein